MKDLIIRNEELKKLPSPYRIINTIERASGFEYSMHQHTFFQTIYVTQGDLQVSLKGKKYSMEAGQCCILRPNVPHGLSSERGYAQIGIDLFDGKDERGILEMFSSTFRSDCTILTIPNAPVQYTSLYKKLRNLTSLNMLIVANMAEQLILYILENSFALQHQTFRDSFLTMMAEENAYLYSLDDMCLRMRMSKSNMERLVQKEFGCSAVEYCNRLRLKRACLYLSSTDLPIRAISELLNFYDEAHLSRSFKKMMGSTPSDYRKKHFLLCDSF